MKPQKALHMFQETDKVNPKYIGHNYAVFEKHDGWYGYMDFSDGQIMSRQERLIPSLVEFSKTIKLPIAGRLIFEIMVKGVPDFHTMNGILNRSKGECECHDAYLKVHDFIPEGHEMLAFENRYELAYHCVSEMSNPRIRLSPILDISNNKEDWQDQVENIWSHGGEGIILKKVSAGYSEGKRNADLMKIKEELTLDLEVVGMEIGEGKYSDTLGSLIVKGKDGVRHNVSGMKDAERYEWWDHPDTIIGRVAEIKAMKKLKDGTLREPRFKAVRWDKAVSEID